MTFKTENKFHMRQAIRRSEEIYELAKDKFGDNVQIEFRERGRAGQETLRHFEPLEKLASDYFDVELPADFWDDHTKSSQDKANDDRHPLEEDLPF